MKVHSVRPYNRDIMGVFVNDSLVMNIDGRLEVNLRSMTEPERIQAVRDANRGLTYWSDKQIGKILKAVEDDTQMG